jgi:hypothetical protein
MPDRHAPVLPHWLRGRILLEYEAEPACPSDVARRLGRPVNLVSYHTGVLARQGCVELVRTERRRGALTRYYRATGLQLVGDEDWARLPAGERRSLVLEALDHIAAEARQGALAGGFDGANAHLTRWLVALDAAGEHAVDAVLLRAAGEIAAIAAASRARPGPRRVHELALLAFAAPAGISPSAARSAPRAVREEARG